MTFNINKMRPAITHQTLYAKGFYQHSGDVIKDMRKVCQLDMPTYDFRSPNQILKFMRKQYNMWLDQTPEVHRDKEGDNKVAWEDDPVKAEMWHILIAYSCYIPMTTNHGFINGLPRYDVLKPQYNVGVYHFMDSIFDRGMSNEQLVERAKEFLSMPNTEIMDIIADRLMKDFNFKKAEKLLAEFGETITANELDDELWDAYSNLVGWNLNDDETLPERHFHLNTKHFSLYMNTKFGNNSTMDIDVNLVPKRWEVMSESVVTPENFKEEYIKCCDKLIDIAKEDFEEISKVCEEKLTDDKVIWESPKHMHNVSGMLETAKEVLHEYIGQDWTQFDYDGFSKLDKYGCLGLQTGCFGSCIFNDNGKMKVILEMHTLWETGCYDHSLHNYGTLIIDEPQY